MSYMISVAMVLKLEALPRPTVRVDLTENVGRLPRGLCRA